VTFTGTKCDAVYREMTDRIHGSDGWVDPHNAGLYSVLDGSVQGKELHSKRQTGNKQYTDLQLFEFSETGGDCVMTGCSESQVTSYEDFSTNYCNLHDLYCGSADGCKFVKSDLKYTEDVKTCSRANKGQCKPKNQALMFLAQTNNGKPGGDFDANGCRHSIGETYCAATHKCIRPWEEKCEAPKVSGGGDLDAHGCKPSTGEVYCATTHKCIRPWEEKCGEETLLKAGGDLDANGCKPSTGEQYCATLHKCIRPWEEKCEAPKVSGGGDLDAHGCKPSTGEVFCATTRKCIRPWEEKCEELGCSDCQARQQNGENIACPMCVMTI